MEIEWKYENDPFRGRTTRAEFLDANGEPSEIVQLATRPPLLSFQTGESGTIKFDRTMAGTIWRILKSFEETGQLDEPTE